MLILIGSGGHATVLAAMLRQLGKQISGVVDPHSSATSEVFNGVPRYESDEIVLNMDPSEAQLINGIGSLPGKSLRSNIHKLYAKKGFKFGSVLSPFSVISPYAKLGEGVQVMPGCIIQPGAQIGAHTIINSGAIIEHDCSIGAHNHIAPGAIICGDVKTGGFVHIGTGANVIQGISIAENCLVRAGETIKSDVN